MSDTDGLARQGWSPADLDANRAGRLSPAQVAALRARMRSYVRRVMLWTSPVPLLATAGGIAGAVIQHEPAFFVLPAIGWLTVAPIWLYVMARARRVRVDLDAGRVETISGQIAGAFVNSVTGQARVRIGYTRMECFGPGGDRTWQATRRFLTQSDVACAYYLPRSRMVVAAESATPSSA